MDENKRYSLKSALILILICTFTLFRNISFIVNSASVIGIFIAVIYLFLKIKKPSK